MMVSTRQRASLVSYVYAKLTYGMRRRRGDLRKPTGTTAEPRQTLTTNLLLTFSKITFSLRAIDSPFLFFILFFSSFLQAYIFPVALTWQAHTCGTHASGHCSRLASTCITAPWRYLSESSLPQNSVLPEGIFGDGLPDRPQKQKNR